MPVTGLEPVRVSPADFESATSANSITPAYNTLTLYLKILHLSSTFGKAFAMTYVHIRSAARIKYTIIIKSGIREGFYAAVTAVCRSP